MSTASKLPLPSRNRRHCPEDLPWKRALLEFLREGWSEKFLREGWSEKRVMLNLIFAQISWVLAVHFASGSAFCIGSVFVIIRPEMARLLKNWRTPFRNLPLNSIRIATLKIEHPLSREHECKKPLHRWLFAFPFKRIASEPARSLAIPKSFRWIYLPISPLFGYF
jgi:hypothetical protein